MKDYPFFISGFPRSGTTLLATLIGRHRRLTVPPETQFFRVYMARTGNKRFILDELSVRELCHFDRIVDLGLEPREVMSYCIEVERREDLLWPLLAAYRDKMGAEFVGEKTPTHMLYLDSIVEIFPDVKMIYIVRDGRDAVFSNIREKWTHGDPIKQAAEWNHFIKKAIKLISRFPEHVLTVRYEDLVSDPQQALGKICDFLGVSFEEDQLDPSIAAGTVPEWERAWKGRVNSAVAKNNIYKWRTNRAERVVKEISAIMKNGLEYYGYDTSPAAGVGRLTNIIYRYPLYGALKQLARLRPQRLLSGTVQRG